ncbi:DNA-processing protein DprA [Desulfurispirillum indicum]|uniref:DNA-processing protein DprA n=1 Tax=Desulfurispirillum indicum TaxID=936456 RepID=UPI001CF95376|nr:DNA-processing protein DprA [Desulfurispirillum indicum]UCZ56910.1 DNA-processing protein DprA [Desulfurispirillum indicum]
MRDYFTCFALREHLGSTIYRQETPAGSLDLTALAREVLSPPVRARLQSDYEAERQLLGRVADAWVVSLSDDDYPRHLRHIPDPPLILYGRGTLPPTPALAVVGSRGPTTYGKEVTRFIASDLARNGMCIVSGLARGIDAIAHEAALGTAGNTVAVMGCGIERIYPAGNRRLAQQIVNQGGAVITEFAPGSAVQPFNFPRRNRIISGMSLGVLVVEAALKSGTMITARLALNQGREVFAVPGNIFSAKSAGSHWLLQQGAHLAASALDIANELSLPSLAALFAPENTSHIEDQTTSAEQRKILSLLRDQGAMGAEELRQGSGLEGPFFLEVLAELELLGYISHNSGRYYLERGTT